MGRVHISARVYPWLQPRVTSLANRTPLALIDLAGVAVLLAVVLGWILRMRRRRIRCEDPRVVDDRYRGVGGIVYLWFVLGWGLNYRREPLREDLDFRDDRVTAGRLA